MKTGNKKLGGKNLKHLCLHFSPEVGSVVLPESDESWGPRGGEVLEWLNKGNERRGPSGLGQMIALQ